MVKAEDSWLRGCEFKPPLRRPFFRHHSFGSKPGAKIEWKLTWHCCICCNPAKGRVEFVDGWHIKKKKSSFITKDEMELVSKPGPNSHKKKKKKKIFFNLNQNIVNVKFKTHLLIKQTKQSRHCDWSPKIYYQGFF